MALTSAGLTDSGMGRGMTTNFHVQYEDTLPNQANVIRNANALLPWLENEFNVTTGWFNTPGGKFGTGNRQVVNLNLAFNSGANNSGYGSAINMDAQDANGNATTAGDKVKMLFMNEWVEILMSLSGGKWNAGNSMGEALSQYCGIIRTQAGHYDYYNSWVEQWMDKHPRENWVSNTEGTDGNAISFGCGLAFIYYLNAQLNFTINQIIVAGDSTFAKVYQNLTGDSGDPWLFFAALLEHVYPSSAAANIPGPITDNPYPLAQLSFWVDKDTFGKDEVQDVIGTAGGDWQKAFWVVVEGFSKNSFIALGATIPSPTGPFANLPHIAESQTTPIDYENAALPQAPQRIRVPYDVTFDLQSLPDFPASGSQTYELDAQLDISGTKVPGSDASTEFELVAGADPYFTNIDPNQNNVFYLSQDLRIFAATPGQNNVPVPGGPQFTSDSVAGAFDYIQRLMAWLNNNFWDPNGTDPFNTVLPGQGGALQGDSSVAPITVDWSDIFNIKVFNNYNFAVARVRLRAPAGPSSKASDVRVFFRLWSTETADTDYQTGSTYPSVLDAAGLPSSPLVGASHHTLPFFATGNLSGNTDYGTGRPNQQDVQVNTGDSVWRYFACFLNLYDSSNVIDAKQVQQWLNGTHHCIVAQIAYDGAPVIPGASPESSDKLAQRNLQMTLSGNPESAATHRIPQTFDVRPSVAMALGGGLEAYPDELMIDWGTIPVGAVVSIFWPQVAASDVVALASKLYSTHTLSAADDHTVQCKVTGGVTYVPIPFGTVENFAGLLTVELPTTVVTGQEFNVVIRRVSTAQPTVVKPVYLRSPPATKAKKPKAAVLVEERKKVAAPPAPKSWRYVTGTFQVKIPVSNAKVMLFPEENTLAIMKWRLQQLEPSSRWYPVLERYVRYIAARVDGLGGDSSKVIPSPNGIPPERFVKLPGHEYLGKVCEVYFDCFGIFEGFALRDCERTHIFKTRERGTEEVVLRACKDQLLLSVSVDRGREGRIRRLAIVCC